MKNVLVILLTMFVGISIFGCTPKAAETAKVESVLVVAETALMSSVRIYQKFNTGRVSTFVGNGIIVQNTKGLPLLVLTDVSVLEKDAFKFSITLSGGVEYNLQLDDMLTVIPPMAILKSVVDMEEDGPFAELNGNTLSIGNKLFTVVNSFLDETTYTATHTFAFSITDILYRSVKFPDTKETIKVPFYIFIAYTDRIKGIINGSGIFNVSGQLIGLKTPCGIYFFSESPYFN